MHILAVDDDHSALETLQSELGKVFPHDEIHSEQNAIAALAWSREVANNGKSIDYAFLDVKLEGMIGLELARQLKITFPKIILIFCTYHREYALEAFELCAKGYLLKPITGEKIIGVLDEMVENWRSAATAPKMNIHVRTFGYFEVFVNDTPLVFERKKAKELLAYLVDRHGTSATTEQIASVLWESENYDRKLKNRTTTTITSLKNTLNAAGISSLLIKSWNQLSIDTAQIQCDAYDFENGDISAINAFHGEYMAGYSWAEFTNGKYCRMELEKTNMASMCRCKE